VNITAIASHAVHQDLINAISWMTAALRHSPHDRVSYSTSLVEVRKHTGEERSLSIKAMEIQEIQASQACWHPIFPHAVIAKGFPYRSRIEGEGLEISFANMVHMSRGWDFVEFDEGFLIEGLTSLLIPVSNLLKDDALQWHFEDKTKQDSRRRSSKAKILESCGIDKWHKTLSSVELMKTRCFLGWVARAEVVIGTSKYDAHIRPSNAEEVPTMKHTNSHTITISAGLMGFGTLAYQRSWLPFANPSQLVFVKDKDICDTLADRKHDTVLVYDVAAETAWCLPQSSIVLYLAHAVLGRREYKVFHGDKETPLDLAEPGPDGSREASKVLKDSLKFKVRKHDSGSTLIEEDISDTYRDIWHTLNVIEAGLETAEVEYGKVGLKAPKYLHGVEFTDVVKMKRSMKIKQAMMKIPAPWTHLKSHSPIVLFCKGLDSPIIPVHSTTVCDSWKNVPENKDYLVIMEAAIQNFLEDEDSGGDGSRLHENIEWIEAKSSFPYHRNGDKGRVLHTQQLRSVTASKLDKHIRDVFSFHDGGCFIFSGDQTPKFCSSKCSILSKESSTLARAKYPNGTVPTSRPDGSCELNSISLTSEHGSVQELQTHAKLFSNIKESMPSSSTTTFCDFTSGALTDKINDIKKTSIPPPPFQCKHSTLALRRKPKLSTLCSPMTRSKAFDCVEENIPHSNENSVHHEKYQNGSSKNTKEQANIRPVLETIDHKEGP